MKSPEKMHLVRDDYVQKLRDNYLLIMLTIMHDIVVSVDKDGKLIFVNDAGIQFFGKPQQKILGTHFTKYIHPPDVKKAVFALEKLVEEKNQVEGFSLRVKSAKGLRTVAWNGIAVCDEEGKYVGAQATGKDITDLLSVEEKLRASEARFKYFLDNAPEPIWIQDISGTFLDGNKRVEKLTGYKKEELVGKNLLNILVLPDQIPRILDAFHTDKTGAIIGPVELNLRKKDGSLIFVEGTIIPVERNGKIEIIGISRDITERKQAEIALKESEEKIRAIMRSAKDAIILIDPEGKASYWNDAAENMFGYSKKEIIGKDIHRIIGPERFHEDIAKQFGSFRKGGKGFHVGMTLEMSALRKDGTEFPVEISISSFKLHDKWHAISIVRDITERKEVEDALSQERELLETITGNINAGLILVSKDYTILWKNTVMEKYVGDVEGKKCYKVLNNKTDVCPGCGVKEIFDTGKDWVVREQVITTPDGQEIWLEITATAIRDEEGNVVAASEMSLDITERKRMENKIQESLQKFRTIFEGATEGILAVDPATKKFVFANPQMSKITGYPIEEFRQLGVVDILRKEDIAFGLRQFENQLTGRTSSPIGIPLLRKDHSIVYCDATSSLMKIGKKQYLVGFLRDVTEQRKAEEKLRESEEKYREIINGMNDTAIVLDFDGKIIDANNRAVQVLGYSREELLSSGPQMFDSQLTIEQIKSLVNKMKYHEFLVFETEHTTKNGKHFPVEVSSTRINYQGKQAIISIARDITERKKAQLAINSAMHLLEESNKELESYTYVVSHDLKAPLRTVRSFGSFLLEDYGDKLDETGKDYLNRMVNAASHMDTLIEDLLVLSRVGRKFTEFETVDLNKLLKEIIEDIDPIIKERKARIVVDQLPIMLVQRVWGKQLFMNMISNALKFNESKIPKIEILYQETENDHLFTIRDNGIGIEKKYLDRIFNLFERAPTEKKYDGTGAGLSICKKIVEQLGGKIWVESTVGKGSSFMFTIPKEISKK